MKRDPKPEDAWSGREITVGDRTHGRPIVPRLVGPAVEAFKHQWGICRTVGCAGKIGHKGECQ